MFEEEKRAQFVGFIAWFAVIAAALHELQLLAADDQSKQQVAFMNPWVGAHWQMLVVCCGVMVFAVGAAIPALSMFKDDGRLELCGSVTTRIVSALAVPAIFFVLGVAWYSSRT